MKLITKENFKNIEVGEVYLMVSPQFKAANHVICISDDFTGMIRNIKYFAFIDKIGEVVSAEQFKKDMKNNCPPPHTFAVWDFNLDSSMFFPLTENNSHIKFCVTFATNGKTYHDRPKMLDHYENFDNYTGALKRYREVLKLKTLFNANLSIVLKSTD